MTISSMRPPDAVYYQPAPDDAFVPANQVGDEWHAHGTVVRISTTVQLESSGHIARVALRWLEGVPERALIFADAWERTYGDSGWSGIRPDRILPWFWLAHDATTGRTTGAGVLTQPAAWCSWTVDVDGVTLWLDVRSGMRALVPGQRTVEVATVIAIDSVGSAYDAHTELTEAMAPEPIPTGPFVGSNNWYYAYGHGFDADAVVRDARTIVSLADGHPVAPFAVIDAGWGEGSGSCDGGPFERGKGSFADMEAVADRIRAEGARPGLWYRPLLTREERSPLAHAVRLDDGYPLDPSLPGVLERVEQDVRRFTDWGFDLVKHDFSTFDITGAFAPAFGARMGSGLFTFSDQSRTTAELITAVYRSIAKAAGDTVVIGCNTVGHLAAGLVAINRVGDDTSGKQWERTRRMGVNALAMRLPQHGRFFAADADCVAATPLTPWQLNRRFLDLVAKSGTPLFLSLDPASMNAEVRGDVAAAVRIALDGGVSGGVEPLDYVWSATPRRWRVGAEEVVYDWSGPLGGQPFIHGV